MGLLHLSISLMWRYFINFKFYFKSTRCLFSDLTVNNKPFYCLERSNGSLIFSAKIPSIGQDQSRYLGAPAEYL